MRTISGSLIALITAATMAASYSGCSSSGSNSCGSDKDCKEKGDICVEHQCVPYQGSLTTPEMVINEFKAALSSGDLERTLDCFEPKTEQGEDPAKRAKYRQILTDQNYLVKRGIIPSADFPSQESLLKYIGGQMKGMSISLSSENGPYFVEAVITLNGQEYQPNFSIWKDQNGKEAYRLNDL